MTLATALAALPDDPLTALRDLLLVWEEHRAIAIADLITALDARLAAGAPVLDKPAMYEDKAWIAIAKKRELADVGWLLGQALHENPHWNLVRLETMIKYHGLDARVSAALLALAEHEGGDSGLWWNLFPLFKRFTDPRAPELLQRVLVGERPPSSEIADKIQALSVSIDRAVARRPPLSANDKALVGTLAEAIARTPEGKPAAVAKPRPKKAPKGKVAKVAAVGKPIAGSGEIAAILARKDPPEETIAALVEAWRDHRHPQLAELIVRLGTHVERPALPVKPAPAALSAWLACLREDDPADAERLSAGLRVGTVKQMVERLGKLAETPAHPRFADAAIEILRDQPFTSASTRALYGATVKLLAAIGDPRTVAWLADIQQHRMPGLGLEGGTDFRDFFAAKIKRAIADASKRPRPGELAPADRDAIAAALKRSGAPPDARTEAELLAAIWANPADDGPRIVYADWLQEHGRPHGELIVLQIARGTGEPSAEAARREAALIDDHWRDFLGPLAPAIQRANLVFERGFVTHAEIPDKRSPLITEICEHPAWATVKTFYAWHPARRQHPTLIAHLEKLGARGLERAEAKQLYGG